MTHCTEGQSHPVRRRPDGEAEDDFLAFIRNEAKANFSMAKGSHDWDHTLRVLRLCRIIGRAERADPLVTQAAAYLHDIGRIHQDRGKGKQCHAQVGTILAENILDGCGLDDSRRENILHCVAAHRYRRGETPETPEARVLFDADKLDAIGAIGIARAFLFAGEWGARLHSPETEVTNEPAYSIHDTAYREYLVKLVHIRDRMLTQTARQMAEARHKFMVRFFNRFLEEYEGER